MPLILPTKQQVTYSLSEKKTMDVLNGELNSTSKKVPAQLTKDKLLLYHIDTLTKIDVKMDDGELPAFYWLPKLHKTLQKSCFISNRAVSLIVF